MVLYPELYKYYFFEGYKFRCVPLSAEGCVACAFYNTKWQILCPRVDPFYGVRCGWKMQVRVPKMFVLISKTRKR